MRPATLGAIVGYLLITACSGAIGPGASHATQALTAPNGDGVNGDGVNGDGVNGDGVNGTSLGHLVSIDLASAVVGSNAFDSMSIVGSMLQGVRNGNTYSGASLVGVSFTGVTESGVDVTLRMNAIQQEAAPNDDTWDYTVSYYDTSAGNWAPLCQDSTGSAVPSYALQGYWRYDLGTPGGGSKVEDSSRFIFACKGLAALGKCVGWGYAPWRTVNGISLDPTHQACVRMVRADFCGDGTSYTQDGNRVDLYDGLGIQTDTEAWVTEAEWDQNGARCFYSYNRSDTLSPVPTIPCYDASKETGCGDTAHFQTGTLIIDEIPPP